MLNHLELAKLSIYVCGKGCKSKLHSSVCFVFFFNLMPLFLCVDLFPVSSVHEHRLGVDLESVDRWVLCGLYCVCM